MDAKIVRRSCGTSSSLVDRHHRLSKAATPLSSIALIMPFAMLSLAERRPAATAAAEQGGRHVDQYVHRRARRGGGCRSTTIFALTACRPAGDFAPGGVSIWADSIARHGGILFQ